jgi:hypothetical protein
MNSQIIHQLCDLPSFCAALYELTKVDKSRVLTMGNWTSILSFKNADNFQFVNFWTLPQAIPRRRRVSIRNQGGVTHAYRSNCCVDVAHVGGSNAIRSFTVLHEQD